jgi:ABC-2 type transport system ATP-binding protein
MITLSHLTKRYDDKVALDDLSFEIKPGVITGFLGPNGSGKSTTMRIIMGLDHPTGGSATINGKAYRDLASPLHEVGALLDAKAVNPGRTARNHLRTLALSNGISTQRVDQVLDFVGLTDVANKRAGDFSLGMSQRLGIAGALLGNPGILLFDEPVNGLDPEGVRWIRDFFRTLADEGRTVFVSSHLMSEMAVTADQIVVIGRGKFITQGSVDDLTKNAAGSVLVRSANNVALQAALQGQHANIELLNDDSLKVANVDTKTIGDIALANSIALYELTPQRASLEDVFMDLTADAVEYGNHGTGASDGSN